MHQMLSRQRLRYLLVGHMEVVFCDEVGLLFDGVHTDSKHDNIFI